MKARDVMTTEVVSVSPETSTDKVAELLDKRRSAQYPPWMTAAL
jgi:predicted transcriptional regulator